MNSWLFVVILLPLFINKTQHIFHNIPWGRRLWLHHCPVNMIITKNWRQPIIFEVLFSFFFFFLIHQEKGKTKNLVWKTETSSFLFVRRSKNCHQGLDEGVKFLSKNSYKISTSLTHQLPTFQKENMEIVSSYVIQMKKKKLPFMISKRLIFLLCF